MCLSLRRLTAEAPFWIDKILTGNTNPTGTLRGVVY